MQYLPFIIQLPIKIWISPKDEIHNEPNCIFNHNKSGNTVQQFDNFYLLLLELTIVQGMLANCQMSTTKLDDR